MRAISPAPTNSSTDSQRVTTPQSKKAGRTFPAANANAFASLEPYLKILLDDSTSAVDTHTDALIREAFRTEIPDVTKFIVAQRILSIKDCDKILILDDGKILDQGNHEELLSRSPIYRELVETQLGGGDFDAE